MGKNGFKKCLEVMKLAKENGYTDKIPLAALVKYIRICIGIKEQTVNQYIVYMQQIEFLKRTESGIFKINWDEIEKYLFKRL